MPNRDGGHISCESEGDAFRVALTSTQSRRSIADYLPPR
jgi:hypothetical protein